MASKPMTPRNLSMGGPPVCAAPNLGKPVEKGNHSTRGAGVTSCAGAARRMTSRWEFRAGTRILRGCRYPAGPAPARVFCSGRLGHGACLLNSFHIDVQKGLLLVAFLLVLLPHP